MKQLNITSKSRAKSILLDSLFKPVNGHTLIDMKLDNAKYKPEACFIGKWLEVPDDVYAVYKVIRSDSYGKYAQLRCVCSN